MRPIRVHPVRVAGLIFACVIGSGLPASGDSQLYRGTFVEQITSTADTNLYHVGQTFTGYYQFLVMAGATDGSAATAGYQGSGSWSNYTLNGSIYLPFSSETTFSFGGVTNIQYTYGPGGQQVDLTQSANGGALTFQTSHVTGFDWSYDVGGFQFDIGVGNAGTGTFQAASFYDTPGGLTTSGTVQFGDPVVVPEPGVTVLFLAGMAGVIAWKRREVRVSRPASVLSIGVREAAGGIQE